MASTYMFQSKFLFFLSSFFFLIAWQLKADYITLIQADKCETIVEIRIDEGHVRLTFEIGEKDAAWFKNIIPEKFYPQGYAEANQEQAIRSFFLNDFPLVADSRLLTGEVKQTDLRERIPRTSLYTGKVDTTSTASKYVIFVDIVYLLKGKPRKLSITPPLQHGYTATLANIGFVTYHKNIPVNDIRYLGTKETINLNWQDPWYSKFENINIRRHHNSSLMSFLYIDPYEVRHEILGRIKDLEGWIDLNFSMDDIIQINQQENLKSKIAQFLIAHNIVDIDGEKPAPIIDKVHFVEVNMYGIQVVEKPKPMDYASAIIGVIFAYPNPGIPQKVSINWDMFNKQITSVPNTATDPAGPMPYILTPDDNILVWQNFLKKYKLPTISEVKMTSATVDLPFLTLFLIAPLIIIAFRNRKNLQKMMRKHWILLAVVFTVALLVFPLQYRIELPFIEKQSFSKPEAQVLVDQLLKNTYRAFDFREESDIYDKLALSSSGDLLADVYLQTRKSMVIENQGGIRVKVKDVKVLYVEEVESVAGNLAYNCKWQVSGTVGHWGHIHRRTNQYEAIVRVIPFDGVWKMVGLDMIEEVRL
jgi:hypothetical protein